MAGCRMEHPQTPESERPDATGAGVSDFQSLSPPRAVPIQVGAQDIVQLHSATAAQNRTEQDEAKSTDEEFESCDETEFAAVPVIGVQPRMVAQPRVAPQQQAENSAFTPPAWITLRECQMLRLTDKSRQQTFTPLTGNGYFAVCPEGHSVYDCTSEHIFCTCGGQMKNQGITEETQVKVRVCSECKCWDNDQDHILYPIPKAFMGKVLGADSYGSEMPDWMRFILDA